MVITTLATGAVIAASFNLLKPFAEAVMSTDNKTYAATMRLLVVLLGAAVGVCQLLLGQEPVTQHAVLTALLVGAGEGLTAITLYHLVPGSPFEQVTLATPLSGSVSAPGPGATVTFLPPVTHTSGLVAVATVPPVTHAGTPPPPVVVPVPPPAAPVLPASEELVGVAPLVPPPTTETPPPAAAESGAAG